jgi:hypothetical protein
MITGAGLAFLMRLALATLLMAVVAGVVGFLVVRSNRRALGSGGRVPPGAFGEQRSYNTGSWRFTVTCRRSQWMAAFALAWLLGLGGAGLSVAWAAAGDGHDPGMLACGVFFLVFAAASFLVGRGVRRFRIDVADSQLFVLPLRGEPLQASVWEIDHLAPHGGTFGGVDAYTSTGTPVFRVDAIAIGYRPLVAWLRHWRPELAWPKGALESARQITGDQNL